MQNFFDTYFLRYNVFPAHISQVPHPELKLIVIIPSYNEPDIEPTLKSLLNCKPTKFPVEVIVVINSRENDSEDVIRQNEFTISQIEKVNSQKMRNDINIYYCREERLPRKHAGVGFARKIGMDEAVRRFAQIGNSEGVIINFDADSTCNYEYLYEIENFFLHHPKAEAVSIYFQHDIDSEEYPEFNRIAIAKYELYMRYYILAQRYAGFPHAFHTMGSSFAVRVKPYCLEGGMNRRQAGEDFYFLQKVIPRGKFFSLNSAVVYPSIRCSQRVPFGTGMTLTQMKSLEYSVFDVRIFEALKKFFSTAKFFFTDKSKVIIDDCLTEFLSQNDFYKAVDQMVENSTNETTFLKRFFTWFDAFRLLKFLHFIHEGYFSPVPVEKSASQLLDILGIDYNKNDISAQTLLRKYRELKMDV